MNQLRWFSLVLTLGIASINAQEIESDPVITLECTVCFGAPSIYGEHL